MRSAKEIVFRYNGDPSTEEIDLDMDGDKSVPERGSFVERKGERWKVVQVNVETNAAEPFEVPIIEFSSPTSCDFYRRRTKSGGFCRRATAKLLTAHKPTCGRFGFFESVRYLAEDEFSLSTHRPIHRALTRNG